MAVLRQVLRPLLAVRSGSPDRWLRARGLGASFVAALVACAADGGRDPDQRPRVNASLVVHNQSQFDLVELRLHSNPDYRVTSNLLVASLGSEDRIIFYGGGEWFVTHFREEYARGPIRAFTTATPVTLVRGAGYRLTIFDESFRLENMPYVPPERADVPTFGEPFPDGIWTSTSTSSGA